MTDFKQLAVPEDAFKELREKHTALLISREDGEEIVALLGYKAVRNAAKDWKTFTSDTPFRVPIPSEEDHREVRQLPIETDPPAHTDYRALVESFFRQPNHESYQARVARLINNMLDEVAVQGETEVVKGFALALQSTALTYLMGVPESEGDLWASWGTHVYHDGTDHTKALDEYIQRQLDRGEKEKGDDFFGLLSKCELGGRRLSRDEKTGFANLAFLGGRDTVINSITSVIAYITAFPDTLDFLAEDSRRILTATEEFFRVISPITHIGRTCTIDTTLYGVTVKKGQRISLNWASANFDESVFKDAGKVILDRKPNPHVAFGSGAHNCLGAHQARLIIRTLLQTLVEKRLRLEVVEARSKTEVEKCYKRRIGFEKLKLHVQAI
jgi:cytochrome P450